MDDEESPPIQQTLLPQSPNKPKPRFRRRTIIFSFLLLLTLIATSFTLYSYLYPSLLPPLPPYLLHSPRYYCHVTPYPDLCFTSMSSTLNASSLSSDPTPIFSNSIQIAIDHLNSTATKMIGNSTGITKCRKLVHDSLSRLNESMLLFREGNHITWFSFGDLDDVMGGVEAAGNMSWGCLALGVEEEVKVGVETAVKCVENSLRLLEWKQRIVADYYNESVFDVEEFYFLNDYNFNYGLFYCVFAVMYVLLGLLYYLLLRGD